jgi:hypothetical protein
VQPAAGWLTGWDEVEAQLPLPFAVVPLIGGGQAGRGGHGGGGLVAGMDVGDDGVDRVAAQPADECAGGFGGEALALPLGSHDPGDLGGPLAAGAADRCLDRAD